MLNRDRVACTAHQEPSVHCWPCSANPTLKYLLSTRMEIHDVTQDITGHCRAFNVPPWTPHSPRRLPFRFSLLAFLQQMRKYISITELEHQTGYKKLQTQGSHIMLKSTPNPLWMPQSGSWRTLKQNWLGLLLIQFSHHPSTINFASWPKSKVENAVREWGG